LGRHGRQDGQADSTADLRLVLTRPDANPESLSVAPDIAKVIRDGKARPAPSPNRIIAGMMSIA